MWHSRIIYDKVNTLRRLGFVPEDIDYLYELFFPVLGLLACGMSILAAILMMVFPRCRWLVIMILVISALPVSWFCFLGVPIAIWAYNVLYVLTDDKVKRALR